MIHPHIIATALLSLILCAGICLALVFAKSAGATEQTTEEGEHNPPGAERTDREPATHGVAPAIDFAHEASTNRETNERAGELRAAYKYMGNSFSMKFHRPSCPFARVMWRCNVVRFPFRKDAVERGYKPCKYCLPQSWKSVGAKILSAPPLDENGKTLIESATTPSCKEGAPERHLEGGQDAKSATDEGKRVIADPEK
ncbi:MAG: hypothetical protein K2X93_05550 [Candidatus Obscuribacterales bacterium]|nr:hypothetical protein [Candidatus Obscuribacterales bacterium]